MFDVRRIDSLDLPELAPYRTLKRSVEHEVQGIFVAEGDKVVHRLLESSFEVISVLLPAERLVEFEPWLRLRPEKNLPVHVVARKEILEKLVGFDLFQGVLAIGRIPSPHSLAGLIAANPSPRLWVAVDGLTNAENIGVLVRNCVAFGTQALLVGETCASPFLRRAVRNSMGAIFHLPVFGATNLVRSLSELRAQGIRCIAAHPHTDQKELSQANLSGDCCLVFGSEGKGISPPVLAACPEAVAIKMPPTVDSLNVGSAAAVFLYEASRQRGGS
ncbi:MAG: RNA methyltransferase [Verrucomicrobia subdivision 3 bacterium]|nr:RNA methyltransferase [Limisphaerales bacterium]